MPSVEEYGVEPIPSELRTTRWRDLFAINFTFFLNPVMYVVGALAVTGFRKNVKLIAKRSRQPTVRSSGGTGSTPYRSTSGTLHRPG